MRVTLIVISSIMLAATAGAAPCDRLSAGQKKTASAIFRAVHPYDCCDETLDRCLKQFKVCKLARRLRDDVCRRLKKGQSKKKIRDALNRRARSMMGSTTKASFDLAHAAAVGPKGAPVTVVAYACARCPFCSKVIPDLHRLATGSGLKGKLRLCFRPFPIRGHAGAVEGGLAMMAAIRLGKFWPFMGRLYGNYNGFAVDKLEPWAEQARMTRGAFRQAVRAKETRKLLVNSKKEGLRNGVNATPTFFINGRKYLGDMDSDSLLDVLDEEADRRKGKAYCGR